MSDTGGPEDPEIAKLRDQLAAAEHMAETRLELEAAQAELERIENALASARRELEPPASSDHQDEGPRGDPPGDGAPTDLSAPVAQQSERNTPSSSAPRTSKAESQPQSGKPSKRAVAGWVGAILIAGIIGGIITLVAYNKDPEIFLACPSTNTQDVDALAVDISSSFGWGLSKIKKTSVDWGDGNSAWEKFGAGYSPSSSRANTRMDDLFRHTYQAPGKYTIYASVEAGNGQTAEDQCTFKWAPTTTSKPTLKLNCPENFSSTSDRDRTVTIGADWSWSSNAGFSSAKISYGDGSKAEAKTPTGIKKIFSHRYYSPGTFTVKADITDGKGITASHSCRFTWTRTKASSSSASRVTTTTVPTAIQTTLTASYRYGETSERVRELQQTIASVTGIDFSADGNYGPTTRRHHLRALSKLKLSTSRVPSPPTTTTTSTTRTTIPPTPKYKLGEYEGQKLRWDPCEGSIRIGMNPNNKLTVPQMNLWDDFFRIEAAELSSLTGLNIAYVGHASLVPSSAYVNGKTTAADILFFFGPPGSSTLSLPSSNFGSSFRSINTSSSRNGFYDLDSFQIHINSNSFGTRVTDSRYIKHYLGRALGLANPDQGSEIMNWGSDGLGSYGDPKWGPGDKIAFGLVGASNGCF